MFDEADRLNEDGSVTIRLIPSNWHVFNVSPDTYQTFTGESWEESEWDWIREEYGEDISDDAVTFTYDHPAIVRDLAQALTDWIDRTLWGAGLTSIHSVRLLDTWSPAYYNFTSDGFEMEFRCDPAQLRELTDGFDVDAWAAEHYRSYDGFHSYVTGRMSEPDWRAQYDGEFRVEHLLSEVSDRWDAVMEAFESEWEIFHEHVTVTVVPSTDGPSTYWDRLAEELCTVQAESLPGL